VGEKRTGTSNQETSQNLMRSAEENRPRTATKVKTNCARPRAPWKGQSHSHAVRGCDGCSTTSSRRRKGKARRQPIERSSAEIKNKENHSRGAKTTQGIGLAAKTAHMSENKRRRERREGSTAPVGAGTSNVGKGESRKKFGKVIISCYTRQASDWSFDSRTDERWLASWQKKPDISRMQGECRRRHRG